MAFSGPVSRHPGGGMVMPLRQSTLQEHAGQSGVFHLIARSRAGFLLHPHNVVVTQCLLAQHFAAMTYTAIAAHL
ncbi:hypothetical protein K6979_16950 [Xanthomonas cucurbitae]|nr:hypothetical protein [Xanthomonas cucurbitae]WDM78794.1 hypothetical protein K6980_16955 [Xanthomonas cucurbitae]WDM82473.1 hypothetical protein K6979_16950 [Xanthomonas cucurbitae]